MRVALMIEGQEGVSWADWIALARACEEHGVEAMFRSDHYLSQTDPGRAALDAWAVIPALAALTERLELGTLVSPVTFRQPAVLANASQTAHEISGGRISLGMGAGWMETEHERFGFPFPETTTRVRWLAEHIEAVCGFWDGRPRPRLIVGGSGRSGTVEPAARWADEYNTTFAAPSECTARRERIARACERAGREPLPFSLMTAGVIGRDESEARDRIRRRLARVGPPSPSVEDWLEQRGEVAIHGTVEQAAERLAEYERAGVERVMLQHLDHQDLEMVELIGRELAPAVA